MQVTLTNAELLALRDIAEETQKKYGQMVADLNVDFKQWQRAKSEPGIDAQGLTAMLASIDNEMNECQLSQAIFQQLWVYLQGRAFVYKTKYSVKLAPVWCFAIRLEFNGVVSVSTLHGNMLQRICDQTHKQYLQSIPSNHYPAFKG